MPERKWCCGHACVRGDTSVSAGVYQSRPIDPVVNVTEVTFDDDEVDESARRAVCM